MHFMLTTCALLGCLAAVLQHGDAKPLLKSQSERELSVLDDLITYLSRRDEELPLFRPPPSKDDDEPTESQNAEPQEDDNIKPPKSGENLDADDTTDNAEEVGGKVPENGGTKDNVAGEDGDNANDNELAENTDDEEDNSPTNMENDLKQEFDKTMRAVERLLKFVKKELENGELTEADSVVGFLVKFLEELEDYYQDLQINVQKTDKALDEIETEMQNAAQQLERNDDESPEKSKENEEQKEGDTNAALNENKGESYVVEEGSDEQKSSGVGADGKLNNVEEGKPASKADEKPAGMDDMGGENEKPASAGEIGGENEQPAGAGDMGGETPEGASKIGGEDGKPASAVEMGGEDEEPASGPDEKPAKGAGEQLKPPKVSGEEGGSQAGDFDQGEDEVRNFGVGNQFKRKENILQNKELLRLIKKLKDLKA